MTKAYFILSEGGNLMSPLIRLYQGWGCTYTHAALVLDNTDVLNPEVVSAVTKVKKGKFYDVHSGFAKQKRWKYYSVDVDESQLEAYKYFANKAVSKGYDVKGIFSFIFKMNTNDPNKYFCTELLYETLYKIGKDLLRNTKSYEVNAYLIQKSWMITDEKELNKIVWDYYGWTE